jgi:hypothetical protein
MLLKLESVKTVTPGHSSGNNNSVACQSSLSRVGEGSASFAIGDEPLALERYVILGLDNHGRCSRPAVPPGTASMRNRISHRQNSLFDEAALGITR